MGKGEGGCDDPEPAVPGGPYPAPCGTPHSGLLRHRVKRGERYRRVGAAIEVYACTMHGAPRTRYRYTVYRTHIRHLRARVYL